MLVKLCWQRYKTLHEAITGASAEEKVKPNMQKKTRTETKVNLTRKRNIRKISRVRNAEKWDITDATRTSR